MNDEERSLLSERLRPRTLSDLTLPAHVLQSYRQMLVTAEPVRRRRLWADGQSIWL